MSVLLSRFFMSLLARDSSSILACSSALTVWSSSFSDCISSLEVVSSSLVDCSSSLVDCSSSLVDVSSSCEVCISSRVVCSLVAGLLEFLLQFRQPRRCGRELSGGRPAAFASTGAATSAKTIITNPRSGSGFLEPLDGDIHALLPAVGPDLESLERHACLFAGALSGRRWRVRSAALRGPWRRCSSWPCRRPVPGICRSGR